MTPLIILWFALMIALFLVWAVAMFRTLYRLNDRAEERRRASGGGHVAGMGHTIATFGEFFTEARWRRDRRRLLLLTALLFLVLALGALLPGPAR